MKRGATAPLSIAGLLADGADYFGSLNVLHYRLGHRDLYQVGSFVGRHFVHGAGERVDQKQTDTTTNQQIAPIPTIHAGIQRLALLFEAFLGEL